MTTGRLPARRSGLGQTNYKISPGGKLIDCTYPENVINYNCIFGTAATGTAALDLLNQQPLLSSYDVAQAQAVYTPGGSISPTPPADSSQPGSVQAALQQMGMDPTFLLVIGGFLLLALAIGGRR